MKKVEVICDSCGMTVSGNAWGFVAEKDKQLIEKDLCDNCMHRLFNCIYGWTKKGSKKSGLSSADECIEEPKKRKTTKKLDKGKIMALRNAGWTNQQIAEEMGVTANAIAVAICNYKKKLEKIEESAG